MIGTSSGLDVPRTRDTFPKSELLSWLVLVTTSLAALGLLAIAAMVVVHQLVR